MSFVQALFLLGAFAVAGPISAHLLARPRYRRVPFTMLRFLQTGEVESQSRRRLQNLLVLLLRCAAILLIALFFAGPERILAGRVSETPPPLVVAVDDSLSMGYLDFFDRAQAAVLERIAQVPPGTPIVAVALASGESLRSVDAGAIRQFLSGLSPASLAAQAAPLFSAVDTATRESGQVPAVFVASDFTPAFRAALSTQPEAVPVAGASFAAILPERPIENGTIDGVQVSAGDADRLLLSVQISNVGESAVESKLTATLNEGGTVSAPVQLAGRSRATVQLALPFPGAETPYASVTIDLAMEDGLAADNHYYFGLARRGGSARRIVILARDGAEAFLLKTAVATLAESNPLDMLGVEVVRNAYAGTAALSGAQVIVLTSAPDAPKAITDTLQAFVRAGGRLIVFVGGPDISNYGALADAGILPARPQTLQQAPLHFAPAASAAPSTGLGELSNYQLESLPVTGAHVLALAPEAEVLWSFESGAPFLCRQGVGRGEVILINTSADDSLSPLMKSPAAVAFASFLVGGAATLEPLAFESGETVELPASEFELAHASEGQAMYVKAPSGAMLAAHLTNQRLSAPRVCELGMVTAEARPARYAGVNVPRGETDLTPPRQGAAEALMDQLFTVAQASGSVPAPANQEKKPLWRAIAWLALALLLADVFVSNRVSR